MDRPARSAALPARRLVATAIAIATVAVAAPALAQDASPPPAPELPAVPGAPPAAPPASPPPRPLPDPVVYAPPPAPEPGTLLGNGDTTHGAFLGPETKITSVADTGAVLVGGSGGWILDHVFVLGGAGYALVSDTTSPASLQPARGPSSTLSLGYGGPRIGFAPAGFRAVHLAFGVLAGGGRVSSPNAIGAHVDAGFFVVEPDVTVQVNVAPVVRLAVGGSYRIAGGTEITGLGAGPLSGPSAVFALQLGRF